MKYIIISALLTMLLYPAFYWLSRRTNVGPWRERLARKISPSMLFGILLATSAALILSASFIQDDAYISFRYAKNLASGNGMVWNIGDDRPVQGYTNFLWTALMALPIRLGINVEDSTRVLGVAIGMLTIIFAYRLSVELLESKRKALFPAFLLSTNYSFLAYCTGGLETQLVALLSTVCWYTAFWVVNEKVKDNKISESVYSRRFNALITSFVAGLAFLTRPDSILATAPCIIYCIETLRSDGSVRCRSILPQLTLPFASLVVSNLSFSYFYYGSILPNTFYIKADSFSLINIKLGALFLLQFVAFYGLIPVVCLLILKSFSVKNAGHLRSLELIYWFMWLAVVLSFLYCLRVGGDFMEFRFLVPIMPIFFILLSKSIFDITPKHANAVLIFLPLVSSVNFLLPVPRKYGVESIRGLNNHIFDPSENWIEIGRRLNLIFPDHPKDVTIGVTPAGVIPYYSELNSIDLLGLNDRYIARNGVVIGSRPGHTRGPTLDYLYDSNINLLVGHPQVRPINAPFSFQKFSQSFCWFMDKKECGLLAKKTYKVISMQIDSNYVIDMLYMSPSKSIEGAIKNNLLSIEHREGS